MNRAGKEMKLDRVQRTGGIPEFYKTFEAEMVHICAPTLAGLKPGSIFSIRSSNREDTEKKIEAWNHRLNIFGLHLCLLSCTPKSPVMNVYLYRPARIRHILSDPGVQNLLGQHGYEEFDLDSCISRLSDRLNRLDGFPHEIGIFLGYPLEDVAGFIENRGQNCLHCGHWKVYSQVEEAIACFERYEKCIRVYTMLFHQGHPIERLAVPCPGCC